MLLVGDHTENCWPRLSVVVFLRNSQQRLPVQRRTGGQGKTGDVHYSIHHFFGIILAFYHAHVLSIQIVYFKCMFPGTIKEGFILP